MLDTTTKRRIDDCRDILVGKLPDPKAQIEQITIGLIYKFMDDMDKEAVELGGETKFFSDYKVPDPEFPNDRSKDKLIEFSKYSWGNLMNPKVSAAEMLTLYSEAIEGMEKNPNIPQLFRDIFSNAYLPYRDPETLKLFLKTIGEFEYTHSEKLGDAFEYLLSVMGSQGDAGQFRTPRHIIDFLVAIIDPDKSDTIMDPACGTAGFLIAAYKHILLKYSKGNTKGLNVYQYNLLKDEDKFPLNFDQLTPDDRKKLIQNFVGYDISPDMVRLSLVNLYLHGFNTPNIYEYDTLSSEERWNESFDVILANPPFMSPKGGIRPHKKFTISSSRSEVLFVDYIAEHLNKNGKAGIIVPEGVLFQSGGTYKDLRKLLIENYLYAVVSLPAGVFNPYSGVITSILLLDKQFSKNTDKILFVKIDNDGYSLGAQRNPINGSQLEGAINIVNDFRKDVEIESSIAHTVLKSQILNSGEINLSGEKYKLLKPYHGEWKLVELGSVCDELFAGGDAPKEFSKTKTQHLSIPIYSNGVGDNSLYGFSNISRVERDAVTISARGTIGYTRIRKAPFLPIVRLIVAIPNTNLINLKYLKLILESLNIYRNGNSIPQLTIPMIRGEKIPLPPMEKQEEIVAEIDSYEREIESYEKLIDENRNKIRNRIAKIWGD
jgi:type I restriction enzyme M protein